MKSFIEDLILNVAAKAEDIYTSAKKTLSFDFSSMEFSEPKSLLITNDNPELTKSQRILVDNIRFVGLFLVLNYRANSKYPKKSKSDFHIQGDHQIIFLMEYARELGLDPQRIHPLGYISEEQKEDEI